MKKKCLLPECRNNMQGETDLPLFCPDHNDYNINKRKCISLYKNHLWIEENGERKFCERCKILYKVK